MNEFEPTFNPEEIKNVDSKISDDSLKNSLWAMINGKDPDKLIYSYEQIVDFCKKDQQIYEKTRRFLLFELMEDKDIHEEALKLEEQLSKEVLKKAA